MLGSTNRRRAFESTDPPLLSLAAGFAIAEDFSKRRSNASLHVRSSTHSWVGHRCERRKQSRPDQYLGIGKIDGPEGLTIYTSIRGVAAEWVSNWTHEPAEGIKIMQFLHCPAASPDPRPAAKSQNAMSRIVVFGIRFTNCSHQNHAYLPPGHPAWRLEKAAHRLGWIRNSHQGSQRSSAAEGRARAPEEAGGAVEPWGFFRPAANRAAASELDAGSSWGLCHQHGQHLSEPGMAGWSECGAGDCCAHGGAGASSGLVIECGGYAWG